MHIHQYIINGITCDNCVIKIKSALSSASGIRSVEIEKQTGATQISLNRHFDLSELQRIISQAGNYTITQTDINQEAAEMDTPTSKTIWQTYKPVFILGIYITVIAILLGNKDGSFNLLTAMRIFMSGFFLSFSFFKMLDLNGFADGYATYDLIAKRVKLWAYIYAFIELGLGIAYAINFDPVTTNATTFVVMAISLAGVLQALMNKKQIQCACLGAVFKLPVSSVTIIEDALMVVMSAIMLMMLKIG